MHRITYLLKSSRFNANLLLLIIFITGIMGFCFIGSSTAYALNSAAPQDSKQILKPAFIDIRAELTTKSNVVYPKQDIHYTFTLENIGSEVVKNLTIKFYAPNEMLSGEFGGNFTRFKQHGEKPSKIIFQSMNPSEITELLKTITWSVERLELEEKLSLEFTVTVDELKESINLIGIMTLSCAPNYFKSYASNVALELLPELTISKSVSPRGPYSPGDAGIYTINFSNNGDRDIDAVIITDFFPNGLINYTFYPADPNEQLNGKFTWLILMLEAGKSGSITISFQVDPDFEVTSPFSIIQNDVAIESGPYGAKSSVSFNVIASDIDAKIDPLPEFYSPGNTITLTAKIKNIGKSPINDPFTVAFYLNAIDDNTQIGTDITVYPHEEDDKEREFRMPWPNPPEGDQLVFVYADRPNVIVEVEEIVNNIHSTVVKVQISELKLVTNEILYFDNPVRDKSPEFPQDVFVYLSVLDQNFHPVRKLAHATQWVANGEMTELDKALNDIWLLAEVGQNVNSLAITEIKSDAGFPIAITIVAPIAKSNLLTTLKSEVCQFVRRFSTVKDKFSVVAFSDHLLGALPFTNNFDQVCNMIISESDDPPTALFDAVYRGIAETAKQPGRRAVIVLTDGRHGSYIQQDEVIEYANRLSVPIFVLNYGSPDQPLIKSMAEQCGGLFFNMTSENVNVVMNQIYDILNNYYIISYVAPNKALTGAWRNMDLTISYPNYLQPTATNRQGIYLSPADADKMWMDIASFPSGLTENSRGDLWKLTQKQEKFEYVITFSNVGNRKLDDISFRNWESAHVTLPDNYDAGYIVDRGQNYVVNFSASVKQQLPLQWLPIINSAKVSLNQATMADALDTVWLIQDLEPVVRVSRTNQPFPTTDAPITITLLDHITIWAGWPMFLDGFTVTLLPPRAVPIDFTREIENKPEFPVGPKTMAFIPDYRPPKKFTEDEIEKWEVRFDYLDQLGQQGFVTTSFFIEARNDLVLDRNVSRAGEAVRATIFIAKENRVKLDIYNEIGEHIKQLVDTVYPKDSNATTTGENVTWNCDSENGRNVGSGVYIFVMQAGKFKTYKKVAVIR